MYTIDMEIRDEATQKLLESIGYETEMRWPGHEQCLQEIAGRLEQPFDFEGEDPRYVVIKARIEHWSDEPVFEPDLIESWAHTHTHLIAGRR